MKYDDLDGLNIEDVKEHSRKVVRRKYPDIGKRIWEMEQNFNEAIKHGDTDAAERYNWQIAKLYKQVRISET